MALISSYGKRVGLANPNDILLPTKSKNLNKHYVSLLVVGGSDTEDYISELLQTSKPLESKTKQEPYIIQLLIQFLTPNCSFKAVEQ